MKRDCLVIISTLVILITGIPHLAHSLGFEAGGGFARHEPSGDVAYKPLSSLDTLDIERDLNYGEEDEPFARIKADLPLLLPGIYVFATPVSFDETGSKTENFTFGDTVFDFTAPFDSRVDMNLYDICLFYELPLLETASLGTINAEIGLNTRIIDIDAEITGREEITGTIITESVTETIPIPMIYAALSFNPTDMLSIEAEGRGIAYNSNHNYDVIGRVKLKPFGPLFIAAGYRFNELKIDYDDIEATVRLNGPFVETGVIF